MPYTTVSGDMWYTIAKKVYGDEYCVDVLMQANPENIGTFQFGAGVVLQTPELKTEQSGSLPPWKVSR